MKNPAPPRAHYFTPRESLSQTHVRLHRPASSAPSNPPGNPVPPAAGLAASSGSATPSPLPRTHPPFRSTSTPLPPPQRPSMPRQHTTPLPIRPSPTPHPRDRSPQRRQMKPIHARNLIAPLTRPSEWQIRLRPHARITRPPGRGLQPPSNRPVGSHHTTTSASARKPRLIA